MSAAYDRPGAAYFVVESGGQVLGGGGVAPLDGGPEGFQALDQMGHGHLGGVGAAVEHGFAEEHAAKGHPVQAADELTGTPDLDRMRVTARMELRIAARKYVDRFEIEQQMESVLNAGIQAFDRGRLLQLGNDTGAALHDAAALKAASAVALTVIGLAAFVILLASAVAPAS